MDDTTLYSNKTRRLNLFSEDEKRALLLAVKERPILWDTRHPKRHISTVYRTAWKVVAAKLNRTVNECRTVYKSLYQSNVYYHRRNLPYQYAKLLSFLPKPKMKKKEQTFPYAPSSVNETGKFLPIDDSSDSNLECSKEDIPISKTQQSVEDLESLEDYASNSDTYETKDTPDGPAEKRGLLNQTFGSLQYPEMYAFWNSIIKELPPEAMSDVRFQTTELLQRIYNKYKFST